MVVVIVVFVVVVVVVVVVVFDNAAAAVIVIIVFMFLLLVMMLLTMLLVLLLLTMLLLLLFLLPSLSMFLLLLLLLLLSSSSPLLSPFLHNVVQYCPIISKTTVVMTFIIVPAHLPKSRVSSVTLMDPLLSLIPIPRLRMMSASSNAAVIARRNKKASNCKVGGRVIKEKTVSHHFHREHRGLVV